MKVIPTNKIAKALNISKKSVLERARREHWQFAKRGDAYFWIEKSLPAEIKKALTFDVKKVVDKPTELSQPINKFLKATEKERTITKMRALIINAYKLSKLNPKDFCKAFCNDEKYSSIKTSYGKPLKERTLYRWIKNYKEQGLNGITPQYSNSSGGAGESLTENEKSLLMHFYLNYNKRSIRHCYLAMRANLKTSIATEDTCRRFLNSLRQDLVTLRRQGTDKFNDKYLPYIEGNKSLYKSLDKVQGDHHTIDVLIKKGKRNLRPYLTSFIDYASGAILGWCISTSPSSRTILAAYHMMITKFGVPKMVHVDNGKDYTGKIIKGSKEKIKITIDGKTETEEEIEILGGIVLCGSKLHYARPYSGRSKGKVENFHKIFEEYFGKNTVSYLGSDNTARVDEQKLLFRSFKGFEKRGDVMEWSECIEAVSAFINAYNNTNLFRTPDATTPQEQFIENLPEKINKPSLATIELALTKGEVRTVQRNGIRFGKSYYWAKELMRFVGQQVVARINLANQNEVLVCDYSGRLLCKAYADVFVETGNMEIDNKNLNRIHRQLRESISADGEYSLPGKPKTLLEVAMEATGETPDISDYIPIENEKLSVKTENKKLPKPKGNGKYKSYFDIDDEEFLKTLSQ